MELAQLLLLDDKIKTPFRFIFFFTTVFRVFLEITLPINHLKLTYRTLLRGLRNKYVADKVPSLIVFSLGANTPKTDVYYGKLLEQIDQQFLYITITGGSLIQTKNSQLIEGTLTVWQLGLLCIVLPFLVPFFVFKLILYSFDITDINHKRIFIYFGLLEIISGSTLNHQISIFAITHFLKKYNAKTVLFPLEGRNWEKHLIRAANSKNVRSIGYLHCALTPRHLSLLNPMFIKPPERPTSIIVPSIMALNLLKKNYGNIVKKGFFLRGSNKSISNSASEAYILFALIGDVAEAKLIINKIINLQKTLSVPIKISLNKNTSSYELIQKLVITSGLRIFDPADCGLPTVCFFRSSSVAIEFMKRGVYLVYLDLNEPISNNIFELDPLFSIESLKITDMSCCTVRKYLKRKQVVDWSKIAPYFLDENFNNQDLKKLLLT